MRRAAKVDKSNPNYKNAGHNTCSQCGVYFHAYGKRKFCSSTCHTESRPRFRSWVPCIGCGSPFMQHVKKNRYCSQSCFRESNPKTSGYKKRPKKIRSIYETCLHCDTVFLHLKSSIRKYCCADCFYASGGALRAGDAAVIAMKKYGAKKDANHNDVFDAIRSITAAHDLSAAGFGVPDGLAWVKDGWQLFDVKNPETAYGRRGLNERQKKWAKNWKGGPVYLIYNVDEATRFAKGKFEGLKRFPA